MKCNIYYFSLGNIKVGRYVPLKIKEETLQIFLPNAMVIGELICDLFTVIELSRNRKEMK